MKQRLRDQFLQEWQSRVAENSVCCNYGLFKKTFCFEEYLTYLPSTLRQRVLKFRLSNHRLPIQQRRPLGIPRDERICTVCDRGEVGDEFHYLLNCSNENVKRNRTKYVDKYCNRTCGLFLILGSGGGWRLPRRDTHNGIHNCL